MFIKNLFQKEKFVLFSKKNKNLKKPQKTQKTPFLVGFLGGFFWVGFLLPTLEGGEGGGRDQEDQEEG